MGRGSATPEQTHCWRCVLYAWRRTALRPDTFRISERWNFSNFGETPRSSERKLPFLSNTPHLAYLTGLLLDFSRCERINVKANVFGSVTYNIKRVYFGGSLKGSNRVGFYFKLYLPSQCNWQESADKTSGRERKTSCIYSSQAKNYDVPSALNHGGFRDELSC